MRRYTHIPENEQLKLRMYADSCVTDVRQNAAGFGVELGDPTMIVMSHRPGAVFPYSVTLVWDAPQGSCQDDSYPWRCGIYRDRNQANWEYVGDSAKEAWPMMVLIPDAYSAFVSLRQQERERGLTVVNVALGGEVRDKGTYVMVVFDNSETAYRLPVGTNPTPHSRERALDIQCQLRKILKLGPYQEKPMKTPLELESSVLQQLESLTCDRPKRGYLGIRATPMTVELYYEPANGGQCACLFDGPVSQTQHVHAAMLSASRVYELGIEAECVLPTQVDLSLVKIDVSVQLQKTIDALADYDALACTFIKDFVAFAEASDNLRESGVEWANAREKLIQLIGPYRSNADKSLIELNHLDKALEDAAGLVPVPERLVMARNLAQRLGQQLETGGEAVPKDPA